MIIPIYMIPIYKMIPIYMIILYTFTAEHLMMIPIYMIIPKKKKNRNKTLCADHVEKGLICHVIPIEVGFHGFIGHSVISFLSKIGITGHSLKVASNRLQTLAQYASSWIWSKARSFQHEGNTRGTTFPV